MNKLKYVFIYNKLQHISKAASTMTLQRHIQNKTTRPSPLKHKEAVYLTTVLLLSLHNNLWFYAHVWIFLPDSLRVHAKVEFGP